MCVCQQDNRKTTGPILVKFGGRVKLGQGRTQSRSESTNCFSLVSTIVNIAKGIWPWQRSVFSECPSSTLSEKDAMLLYTEVDSLDSNCNVYFRINNKRTFIKLM